MRSSGISHEDSVDLYRAKVLPSVERRLAAVPPLVQLQLLNELSASAVGVAGLGWAVAVQFQQVLRG